MANSLLTIQMITREAVRLWKNSNSFISHIDSQYDSSYAQSGAKIGNSLKIRLPNDFVVRTGAAAQPQDASEQSTTLVVATQKGVDVSFSSQERTMSLDDYSKRVLAPMVNNLVGAVAVDVMSGADGGSARFTANTASDGTILSPRADDWLNAGALLDLNSAPRSGRKIVADPLTMARTVSSLSGLFNPSRKIGEQYESGQVQEALNFEWFQDQTVIKHTTGTFSAGGTVNGAGQTGLTLTVNATTGTFAVGDIITIAGVNAVNRITKQSTGQLQQFVITAKAATGATSLSIYPAIVPAAADGSQTQYQTVDASPANSAVVALVTPASSGYRKNLAYVPEAVTLAMADLELPNGVHERARESYDGISMRMVTAFDVMSDKMITRLDVLYGYLWVRPEWVVTVGDAL